jgi:serine/threonine protein phosphatase PrpC
MLEAHGQTDVGLGRRHKLNEDAFLVDPEIGLYVVCDGMGGHNAGEVASNMAVETISAFISRSDREREITWPYGLDANLSFEANRLITGIKLANKKVHKIADSREEYSGMGTTVVAVLVSDDLLTIGSAGDSRCYLIRDGKLSQLTRDDSWVSAAWAEGILSAEEIVKHPYRNVITKAIGAKESIDVNLVEHHLAHGDVILLCSDGLHSMLSDDQIQKLVVPFPATLAEAATRLIAAANEAGGRDNVTVVLLRQGP